MPTAQLRSFPATSAIRLRNIICAYCGCELTPATTTKEHVVGRRFVPKGKLNANWNLILNACSPCNNAKADLENDISAITLNSELIGKHPDYDQDTIKDAQRKAEKSISRRTKKAVQDSTEGLKFDVPIGTNASISFDFKSPPQIDETRAFELARLQLAGFFYMLSYQKDQERGYWWTGSFHPLIMVQRADWGNTIAVDFAEDVSCWDTRLMGHTAEGYFSICIRKHPDAECWSWAVEWNGSTRLLGFFGDRKTAESVVNRLRPLQMSQQTLAKDHHIRFRLEVPLEPEKDRLFELPHTEFPNK